MQEFSKRHDVVLFVCGLKSSNGRVLYEACRKVNENTHFVEDPSQLDAAWFRGVSSVGICGATSTPKWLMERCAERVRELETSETEG